MYVCMYVCTWAVILAGDEHIISAVYDVDWPVDVVERATEVRPYLLVIVQQSLQSTQNISIVSAL